MVGIKTCIKPFTFLELQEDHAFNCCPAWVKGHHIGSYSFDSNIFEIWNSPASRAFRESMFDGVFPYCDEKLCPFLQRATRLADIDDILSGKYGEKLQLIFAERMTVVPPPDHINLCHDPSCNLSCPSCRPKLVVIGKDHPTYEVKRRLQEQVLAFIHSTKQPVCVSLTGSGDPFASSLCFEFLKQIDLDKNPNVTLLLQTNGVMFDEAHWSRLPNIHGCSHIKTYISVDAGTAETYKQTRRGGNWAKLVNNLAFIAGLRDAEIIKHVRLDMVVQDNNFREINDFIAIAQKYDFHCTLMRLDNWGTFSKEEFAKKNIFSESHPEHAEFCKTMLQLRSYEKLTLGNLTEFHRRLELDSNTWTG